MKGILHDWLITFPSYFGSVNCYLFKEKHGFIPHCLNSEFFFKLMRFVFVSSSSSWWLLLVFKQFLVKTFRGFQKRRLLNQIWRCNLNFLLDNLFVFFFRKSKNENITNPLAFCNWKTKSLVSGKYDEFKMRERVSVLYQIYILAQSVNELCTQLREDSPSPA